MIYFLVTCSLIDKHPTPWIIKLPDDYRLKEYALGIEIILNISRHISNSKVILIENNGQRKTFLDLYKGCQLFYTNNNSLNTKNKGVKELKDINDCIKNYGIQDEDFVVKVSGRYQVMDYSPFIERLRDLTGVDCILRYGSFNKPSDTRVKDCITGLIGMRCKYVKQIEEPHENDPVEWKWAWATYQIPAEKVVAMNKLGLYMRPMSTAPLVV
uniref:Uncharacterized protein n=1 Tax=viral metagenome TaxID=1070528 RepID=A0A6C0DJA5_9ZZZZ